MSDTKRTVMLERSLTLEVNGVVHSIAVRINKPEPDPSSRRDWRCEFSIEGIPGRASISRESFGIDSMQAAIMTLQHIRLELRQLQADGLDIRWLGVKDVGFPNLSEHE